MRAQLRFYLSIFIYLTGIISSNAQYVTIPDVNFKTFLEEAYPTCMTGGMLDTTCFEVENDTMLVIAYKNVSDLTGIQYFDSVRFLVCIGNPISSLPSLPSLLNHFICNNNQLVSLPSLPSSLEVLLCHNNQLTNLPLLPPSLYELHCYNNKLSNLPELPTALTYLNCSNNLLSSLPSLPASLEQLDCQYNQLNSLPALPLVVQRIFCHDNYLVELPNLPSSLTWLDCRNNLLESLPPLPSEFLELYCDHNQLACLPLLPNSMGVLHASGNSIICLPNLPSNSNFFSNIGHEVCDAFEYTGGCTSYPLITGTIFVDANSNGVQDPGEDGYANAKLEVQPGNYILTADSLGFYSILMDTGTYSINVNSSYPYYTIAPDAHTITANYGQTYASNDFALQPTASIMDLQVIVTPGGMVRSGRKKAYYVTYKNSGTTTLSGSVQLEYDTHLNYTETIPLFTSHVGNLLTWNYMDLKPGETRTAIAFFIPPVSTIVGTEISFTAKVFPVIGDETPLDNESSFVHSFKDVYSATFKEVSPLSDITVDQIADQDPFTYVVHFQNTGADTAVRVIVKDTLDINFELVEIQTLAASHPYTFKMKNGSAIWIFDAILLVDSTRNEPLSHGFIKYRIIPKNTLVAGDEIRNTAHVFFDFMDSVQTNTTFNKVISKPTGIKNQNTTSIQLDVYPNPSQGEVTIHCSLKEMGTIKVFSAEGRVVYIREDADLVVPVNIALTNEQMGIYYVQVITGDQVITKKIVLN